MTDNQDFPRLVSLACHDLRTPLATVYGFARTLLRTEDLGEPTGRYVGMIEAASVQLGSLLDDLGLAARIEAGRYEPVVQERDTLELAQAAAERGGERVAASGDGAPVETDSEPVERALASLAVAAQRHGAVELVRLDVSGLAIAIAPVTAAAAPVVMARELKDLGAAVALRVLAALDADVTLNGDALTVRFG
jgi:signal transduction histidine kinase